MGLLFFVSRYPWLVWFERETKNNTAILWESNPENDTPNLWDMLKKKKKCILSGICNARRGFGSQTQEGQCLEVLFVHFPKVAVSTETTRKFNF